MFNKYYQDELIYLRQMGREYSQAYPETAKMLAESGSDPDVERMLEGVAFLTGRLRQKLDDELPEITQALIETFWPHFLRPIPSLAMVQFEPVRATDKDTRVIPRGTAIDSAPVDGTRCRFRTAFEVQVPPLRLVALTLRANAPSTLSLRFRCHDGVKLGQLKLTRLRLHCAGVHAIACAVHVCLTRHVTGVVVRVGERSVTLKPRSLRAAGFDAEDALIGRPDTSFAGFSLLHEYFAFPAKFLFVDLLNLESLAPLADATEFTVECQLARVPTDMPQVSESNLLLGCTPVVNEFPHPATPMQLELERREYKVQPSGSNPEHYEISSLASVTGLVQGLGRPKPYRPLYHQERPGDDGGAAYLVKRKPAIIGAGSDCYLMVTGGAAEETLSIEAICTNRRLPVALGPGDINHPTDQCPSGLRFRNLVKPTTPINPPLGSNLEWQLLSHLALNYRTLARVDGLKSLLDLYNIRALVDQQARQGHRRLIESIADISARPATIISEGIPLRGIGIELVLKDDHFDGEGDLHLFTSILDEVFAQYVAMNSFSQLTVRGSISGDVHKRAAHLGSRRLI